MDVSIAAIFKRKPISMYDLTSTDYPVDGSVGWVVGGGGVGGRTRFAASGCVRVNVGCTETDFPSIYICWLDNAIVAIIRFLKYSNVFNASKMNRKWQALVFVKQIRDFAFIFVISDIVFPVHIDGFKFLFCDF